MGLFCGVAILYRAIEMIYETVFKSEISLSTDKKIRFHLNKAGTQYNFRTSRTVIRIREHYDCVEELRPRYIIMARI